MFKLFSEDHVRTFALALLLAAGVPSACSNEVSTRAGSPSSGHGDGGPGGSDGSWHGDGYSDGSWHGDGAYWDGGLYGDGHDGSWDGNWGGGGYGGNTGGGGSGG